MFAPNEFKNYCYRIGGKRFKILQLASYPAETCSNMPVIKSQLLRKNCSCLTHPLDLLTNFVTNKF